MELGASGIEETETGIEAYFPEEGLSLESVERALEEAGLYHQKERIEERNWNELWESSFRPIEIQEELLIRAPFHESSNKHRYSIEVNPARAFGTGHHATTRMVLERLLSLPLEGKRILDMGCGTGILAILCEKRGAREVLAIDNEEWAVRNAQEQIERNGCQRIQVEKGDRIPLKDGRYDVILGNIERKVLLDMIRDMRKVLAAEGRILLSGLRPADADPIHEECKLHGLIKEEEKESEEWLILEYSASE